MKRTISIGLVRRMLPVWAAASLGWAAATLEAFPIITSVVETGGDNEATDTIVAKWTGVTWNTTMANEPILNTPAGTPYTVPAFGEGVPCMVDRAHVYGAASPTLPIPSYLAGGEYIMIGNDNRDNTAFRLDITVSEPALVYLLIDNRRYDASNADPPVYTDGVEPLYWYSAMTWVGAEGFTPVLNGLNRAGDPYLPDEVGYDESYDGDLDQWASVYFKQVEAGTVSTFEYGEGQNMYGVVVKGLPTSINNPPVLSDITPANATLFYAASAGLSFKASTVAPNRLDPENLRLILNGADVSAQLAVSGSSTDRTVKFTGLEANAVYTAQITVSDQAGRSASAELNFDTFSESAGIVIEAEDYNYEGGKSVAGTPPAGYAGLTGTPDADYHDNNTTTAATEYRTADFAGLGVSNDGSRARFTSAGATDYHVTGFVAGDWMNYTRTLDNNAYRVYLRASAGRAQAIRLDRVTGDPGSPTQGRSPLGFFAVPGAPYTYVPLSDASGQPVTLALGGVTTLRLTALESSSPSTQLNFLFLVPVDGPARPPYVSEVSPAMNAMDVAQDSVVAATIVNGLSPVPPGNVTLTFNGQDVTSTASVTATTDGVQVTYDPPGSIAFDTACTVRVAFADAGGTAHAQDWAFTTRSYAPVITGVVEMGGDDSEFTPAQFTGQTFSHPNLGVITVPAFREDVPAYRDRAHQWNGAAATLPLPSYLVGGDYIAIRNDNRDNTSFQLDVTVSAPALVYVLVDNRLGDSNAANPPDLSTGLMSWLEAEGWAPVRTGHNRLVSPALPDEVGLDESGDGIGAGAGVDSYSSIYVREVPAGLVSLYYADNAGQNMYGVVVRATATHMFVPVVGITSPAPDATYPTTPAAIAIAATASVRDSAVTKVEFFEAAAGKLGEALAAPYNFVWNNVSAGRYRLTARATAANGETGVSAPVEVIVGTVISVNFQDSTAVTPDGYLMDVGQVFGDQGNGYSYGWDADNTAHARNRDNVISPDERYDTFNHMQKDLPAGRVWEIELPNGNYSVHVVVGESDNYDSTFDIQAEGVTIISGKAAAAMRWFESTAIVAVTDGRLSLSNGPTAVNNKICCVDIARLPDTMPAAEFAPPTLSGNTVNLTWTGQGRLQEASQVNGPWADVPGNPQNNYSVSTTVPQRFYRVVSP